MHDADMFRVEDLEVTAASVEDSAVLTTTTTTNVDDELTLAKALIAIKAVKLKDKGKAKMIEPEKPLKKKDQIALDEEVARKLKAKIRGFKQKDFKGKRFNDIKKMFDKVYKRVNTFVDINTKNVEESLKKAQAEVTKGISKRAGQELE
nr:hypothetical protein [Tanacetum cinerariifolium]